VNFSYLLTINNRQLTTKQGLTTVCCFYATDVLNNFMPSVLLVTRYDKFIKKLACNPL